MRVIAGSFLAGCLATAVFASMAPASVRPEPSAMPASLVQPAPSPFTAIPAPGSHSASPSTTITVRSDAPAVFSTVTVVGRTTGTHIGKVRLHADGMGLSFTPDRAFAPGELVTVHTKDPVRGAANGRYTFDIGRPAAVSPTLTAPNGPLESAVELREQKRAGSSRTPSGPSTQQKVAAAVPTFASRPDLRMPGVDILTPATGTTAGLLFATPAGPGVDQGVFVYNDRGEPVWFKKISGVQFLIDAKVATLGGQPVITWFEGRNTYSPGISQGSWPVVDSSYRQIARISMKNGYQADGHDMALTSRGTSVMEAYNGIVCDGVAYSGCAVGSTVIEAVIQEIDVETGDVLFEWHSLDHVSPTESVEPISPTLFDYFHLNSVDVDTDGNLLVSGRHVSAQYKIDRTTGAVIWQVGGTHPTITLTDPARVGPATGSPSYPHDFRPVAGHPGTYSYYDNQVPAGPSRACVYRLDANSKTAEYLRGMTNGSRYGATQGRVQVLPDDHVVVGWGGNAATGLVSEYDASDQLIFDARLVDGNGTPALSYRQAKYQWQGTPSEPPTAALTGRSGGRQSAAVSWNGDTRTASWQVLVGDSVSALTPTGNPVPRTGFETVVTAPSTAKYLVVQALDGAGNAVVGGRSPALRVTWFVERGATAIVDPAVLVVGDFGGDRSDDVLQFRVGTAKDALAISDGVGGSRSVSVPALNSQYQYLVGDFVGDDRDEVIWWVPGVSRAWMWRFDSKPRSPSVAVVSSGLLSVPTAVTQALVLDNRPNYGGGADTVLWYASGRSPDRVDSYQWLAGTSVLTSSQAVLVDLPLRPFAGDFDGNGYADVFWYGAGTATDWIWYGSNNGNGGTAFRSARVTAGGDHQVLIGNFVGDPARDEVYFNVPGTSVDYLWTTDPAGVPSSHAVRSSAAGPANRMRSAQDYVLTKEAGGVTQVITFGTGSTATTLPTGNTAVNVAAVPAIGEFAAPGRSSVLWYTPGSTPEQLFLG